MERTSVFKNQCLFKRATQLQSNKNVQLPPFWAERRETYQKSDNLQYQYMKTLRDVQKFLSVLLQDRGREFQRNWQLAAA